MTLAALITLLGSPIPFYNTMGTVSVTLKLYEFKSTSCAHFHIMNYLAFDRADFLLHHGNGVYSFTLVFISILMALFLLKYNMLVFDLLMWEMSYVHCFII